MRSLGLISQVFTFVLSLAIIFLYVVPTFEEIGEIQNRQAEYRKVRQPIDEVNIDLAAHIRTLESFNQDNIQRLETYLPSFVDEIKVMRDLQFIIRRSGMVFKNVEYAGTTDLSGQKESAESSPIAHEFTVITEGTYEQVKSFLSLLEQNEYPLEAQTLEIRPLEGGFLSIELNLITYASKADPLMVTN